MIKLRKDIQVLMNLERNKKILSLFDYYKTSSWVLVKDVITNKITEEEVNNRLSRKELFSKEIVFLIYYSLVNYIKNIYDRRPRSLFIGAGSGIFLYGEKTLDSYFPYKREDKEDVIYFLSADYPKRLYKNIKYIKTNNIVIHSFLFSPIRVLLTKVISFIKASNKFKFQIIVDFLKKNNIHVAKLTIFNAHMKFIAGNILYSVVLKPLRINKLYVVSSYSNSDIISVCKKKGIEIIEMQHGIVGEMHRGYNYKTKDVKLPTPNKIYVYNSFWEEELVKAGFYTKENIEVYGRLKYELLEVKDKKKIKSNFLVFTGQNSYIEEIIEFLKKSNKLLCDSKIILYYLPHPNEKGLNAIIESLKEYKGVKVIKNKKYTTEEYINKSLAHISLFSSCHFDALHYKGQTFVPNIIKNNLINYYIIKYSDKFIKINSIKEILDKIK